MLRNIRKTLGELDEAAGISTRGERMFFPFDGFRFLKMNYRWRKAASFPNWIKSTFLQFSTYQNHWGVIQFLKIFKINCMNIWLTKLWNKYTKNMNDREMLIFTFLFVDFLQLAVEEVNRESDYESSDDDLISIFVVDLKECVAVFEHISDVAKAIGSNRVLSDKLNIFSTVSLGYLVLKTEPSFYIKALFDLNSARLGFNSRDSNNIDNFISSLFFLREKLVEDGEDLSFELFNAIYGIGSFSESFLIPAKNFAKVMP